MLSWAVTCYYITVCTSSKDTYTVYINVDGNAAQYYCWPSISILSMNSYSHQENICTHVCYHHSWELTVLENEWPVLRMVNRGAQYTHVYFCWTFVERAISARNNSHLKVRKTLMLITNLNGGKQNNNQHDRYSKCAKMF